MDHRTQAGGVVIRMKRRHVRGQGTVFKRGKWWHVCYSADGQTFRESAHTQIEEEAKAYLAKVIGSKYAGNAITPSKVRVRDLLRLVEQQYELEERASLYIAKLKINRYLLPNFGNLRAVDLSTSRIKAYISKRRHQAKPATINREIALIRRGFKLGYEHDPPLIARIPKFPELDESDNVRTGFLKRDQYQVLLLEMPEELKLLLVFGYHVGMRRGALLRLKWAWVDLEAGIVRFEEAPRRSRKPVARIIPIFGDMREYLEKQPRTSEYVFARGSEPIKDFRESWRSACIRAGVPELLFHDLRRSAAKVMRQAKIPETKIMSLTGHKTRSMLERYLIDDEYEAVEIGKEVEDYLKAQNKRGTAKSSQKTAQAEKIVREESA